MKYVSSKQASKILGLHPNTLIQFMREQYPEAEIVKDIGSGLNYKRRGLKSILERAMRGEQLQVVVAHKDRLARFGFELIEWIIQESGSWVVVLKQTNFSPEQVVGLNFGCALRLVLGVQDLSWLGLNIR